MRWAGIRLRRPRGRKLGPKAASEVATDPGPSPRADSKPASEVATDLERPRPVRSPSLCEPHREWFTSALEQDRNAMAIWQDLVDRHGFGAVATEHTPPATTAEESAKRCEDRRHRVYGICLHALRRVGLDEGLSPVTNPRGQCSP